MKYTCERDDKDSRTCWAWRQHLLWLRDPRVRSGLFGPECCRSSVHWMTAPELPCSHRQSSHNISWRPTRHIRQALAVDWSAKRGRNARSEIQLGLFAGRAFEAILVDFQGPDLRF